MNCTLCNNKVEVLAHTNNREICLICLAEITKYAFNFGKSFESVLACRFQKVGA